MERPLIYAVEDDYSISELYECTFLQNDMDVKTFYSAEGMFEALKNQLPSAIVLDIMLPEMDGLTALEIMKKSEAYSSVPVIIISAKGGELSKVKGLNSGADDYISKPFGVLELVARVKAVLRRGEKSAPQKEIVSYEDIVVNTKKHSVLIDENPITLTKKEYQLLLTLMQKKGEIVSREALLRDVWGDDYFGETRTLDIHIMSLRHKLKEIKGKEYIQTLRGVGFTLPTD